LHHVTVLSVLRRLRDVCDVAADAPQLHLRRGHVLVTADVAEDVRDVRDRRRLVFASVAVQPLAKHLVAGRRQPFLASLFPARS
jgi:hypothetical protein